MYFANFPTILYDFTINGKTEYKIITDITKNVRFRKLILENIALYDSYDVKDGETPEIISEKVYGTPHYHWVIMLVNQRYDYINDFPLSQNELESLIETKYGDKKDHAHHYIYTDPITGVDTIRECPFTLKIKESDNIGTSIGNINVGTILTVADYGYQARVDEITVAPLDNMNMTVIASMRTGTFQTGLDTLLFADTSANLVSFTIPELYSPISNYQYEESINESKRRIKIVNPRYIDQVLKEFESII